MKRKTIRNHNDFLMPRNGLVARNDFFMVRAKTAKFSDSPRYGIVVTKKKFKLATERNHVKRLLRDWIAYNEDLMLNNLDYTFIASGVALDISREKGREYIKSALKKITRIYRQYEPQM